MCDAWLVRDLAVADVNESCEFLMRTGHEGDAIVGFCRSLAFVILPCLILRQKIFEKIISCHTRQFYFVGRMENTTLFKLVIIIIFDFDFDLFFILTTMMMIEDD